ncbi:family 20 glycosylhydrolase [Chitinophaga sp. SYP-B3965]|nr:family 20 glycosylhydrolase [Chitinophaga sp. SYP-B3965]
MFVFLLFSSLAQAQKTPTITWELVENGYQGKAQSLSTFTIINNTKQVFPASGWTIYYNFIRFVTPGEVAPGIEAGHINGHLYTLKPKAGFGGIAPGDSLKINIISVAWVTNYTDAPDGPYIVWDKEPAKGYSFAEFKVIPSTQDKQLLRNASDKKAQTTAADIYQKNSTTKDIPAEELPVIFPTPVSYEKKEGKYELGGDISISADPAFAQEADFLAAELSKVFGKPVKTGNPNIRIVKAAIKDSYTLSIDNNGILITAPNSEGAFYGIQSLRSLLPVKAKTVTLQYAQVTDAPRFPFRSFMLDVSRNFHAKAEVLRVLDVMALYKLNVFHLHMSDDEGWRIEIPGLPELTEVGGRRGHDLQELTAIQPSYGSGPDINNTTGSGFYTKADYIEILKYANARHIKVIPEVEMPGHARAAIKSMDARYAKFMKAGNATAANEYRLSDPDDKSQYRSVQEWKDNVMNVALPSTYKFLEKVVDELAAMHKEAGAPLDIIHMGGDETPAGVWEKSPVSQQLIKDNPSLKHTDDLWYYFYDKVAQIVNKRGLQLYGWEEAGMRKTKKDGQTVMIANPDFGNRNFQLDVWNNVMGWGVEDLAYRLANAGYKVVLSGVSNYYFDMAYTRDYNEPGFYWGGFVDVDKPFYFIPFDLYKNSKEDGAGNPLPASTFTGKDRLTEYGQENITGIQAALWSETVKTPAQLEYLLLPKLLGMAERAWAKDPSWTKSETLYNEAWNVFANVVGKRELPRLAVWNGGYAYRIPTAGAVVEDGKVLANVQLPGLVIRYSTDGKEPTAKSPVYTAPIAQKGIIKLKVYDSVGRSGRTVTIQN